jgi:hypothetical protein
MNFSRCDNELCRKVWPEREFERRVKGGRGNGSRK